MPPDSDVVTNSRWTGASRSTPAAICTIAPSQRNAVLSAVNGEPSTGACRVRCALEQRAVRSQRLGKSGHPHAGRQSAHGAQTLGVDPVHEDERGPLGCARRRRARAASLPTRPAPPVARPPGPLRDGRDRREAPFLIPRRGKSGPREPLHGGAPDRLQPVWALGGCGARSSLELLHERLGHDPAPTASSSHSYPRASSSSASSLPPDFTILPAESTCTKSGMM